jgi:hypothetical protein
MASKIGCRLCGSRPSRFAKWRHRLHLRTLPVASALVLSLASVTASAGGDLPHLTIEIKAQALRKLEKLRERLVHRGTLGSDDRKKLSVRLRLDDRVETHNRKTLPAKLRLATPMPEDLRDDGWPLRVRLEGEDHVFGMRGFALHALKPRGSLLEALALDQLRREGVLVARTRFARVSLGSLDLGPTVIREQYDKELLESQQRREGVILGFEVGGGNVGGNVDDERGFHRARLLPTQAARIAESEALSAALATSTGLARSFLEGLLPARDVFDLDSMSRFLAVVELWGASRALEWPNLRFYFNPLTQRLEPIASELHPEPASSGSELVTQRAAWSSLLLEDPELQSTFHDHLRRIAEDVVRGEEASRLERLQASLLQPLRSHDPAHASVDLRPIAIRAARLSEIAQESAGEAKPDRTSSEQAPSSPSVPSVASVGTSPTGVEITPAPAFDPDPNTALRVYRGTEKGRGYLELANLLPVEVELLSIERTGLAPWQRTDPALGDPSRFPLELPPPSPSGRLHFVRLPYRGPRVQPPEHVFEIAIAIDGTEHRCSQEALPYFPPRRSSPVPTASLRQSLARHPFLDWDEPSRTLRARAGTWKVSGALILPPGVGLELVPGTTLQFPDDGLLLASGPLRFLGSEEQPVVLEGQPGRGGAGTWYGVVVLESDRAHHWKHVVVRNTKDVDRDSWQLTGGVTIRASEVTLSNTTLQGHRGEDSLNLIRSRFELDEISILDTLSDAFDCDFCSGQVKGGHFARIGGDAIDVSGSEIVVEGVLFEDVRDKALSVGERSRLTARGIEIRGAGTAVACKDGSETRFEDSSVARVPHAALMAYTKKREYGPAQVIARNIRMQEVARAAIAQRGSSVNIDGVEQEPEDIDVEALYRHGYMKK